MISLACVVLMISMDEYEISLIFTGLKHHFATAAASTDRQINCETHSSSFNAVGRRFLEPLNVVMHSCGRVLFL